ncbi:MAG TPA: alpha/beta hydrolase [Pseudonocardiaceae bacterium]|jgi:arylformamidase
MQIAETVIESRGPAGVAGLRGAPRRWRPARPWDTDRAARDCAYTPSSCVPNLGRYLRQYAERSAQARDRFPWLALRYGPDRAEVLHFFHAPLSNAPAPNAPLHVFIHGGYWQELSEAESSFAAPGLLSHGSAFAALGYGLAPRHRLDEIVAMVRRGVLWLRRHAVELGIDPKRVHLSGSSAGAHLVAMCLLEDWLPAGLRPRDVIRGATLLSGIYELEPLRHTCVGDAIGLSIDEAARNSPVRQLRAGLPPLVVARGSNETVAFADEHEELVSTVAELGSPVVDLVVPARNHFDLPLGLGDSRDMVGRAVFAQMGLGKMGLGAQATAKRA